MTPYLELINRYNSPSAIPYCELLLTEEWEKKRKFIVNRDDEACKFCENKETENVEGLGSFWLLTEEITEKICYEDKDKIIAEDITYDNLLSAKADRPYYLHVHHTYYILNTLPWDYPEEAFITLCNWCHWEFHEGNRVPIYQTKEKMKILDYKPCLRCKGAGWFPQFKHVQDGICFRCNGLKYEELIEKIRY